MGISGRFFSNAQERFCEAVVIMLLSNEQTRW